MYLRSSFISVLEVSNPGLVKHEINIKVCFWVSLYTPCAKGAHVQSSQRLVVEDCFAQSREIRFVPYLKTSENADVQRLPEIILVAYSPGVCLLCVLSLCVSARFVAGVMPKLQDTSHIVFCGICVACVSLLFWQKAKANGNRRSMCTSTVLAVPLPPKPHPHTHSTSPTGTVVCIRST